MGQYDGDLKKNTIYVKPNIRANFTPNPKVTDTDWAIQVQRVAPPKDFLGEVDTVWELGSVFLKPHLDSISARLDEVEVNLALTEEADPIALAALATAEADLKKAIADRVTTAKLATELKAITDAIASLDQLKADKTSITALNTAIDGLNDLLTANDATDADIQAQLDKVSEAVEAAKTSSGKSLAALSDEVAQIKADIKNILTIEKDPIATAQVSDLKKVVDALPSAPNIDPLKADIKTVSDRYAQLDTSKADKTALDAANAAIKALQDAMAALPPSGASPAQLKALNDRIAAVEAAVNTAENSKGILIGDARSIFRVGGNLYGGIRRLIEADIASLNQRDIAKIPNPYAAMNGSGASDFYNNSNQWLGWAFKTTLKLWRIEVSYTNINWANRDFRRNGTTLINLNNTAGTYTSTYRARASVGYEATSQLQFVDDGGRGYLDNLYVSVSDPGVPAEALKIGTYTLQVGDRFRYEDGTTSVLYTYQGIDAASGAWKATPVSASYENDLAHYSVVNPRLDTHDTAIAGLETLVAGFGNTRLRRDSRPPEEAEIDGTWDLWVMYQPEVDTFLYQEFKWIGENNAIAYPETPKRLPRTLTEASAIYDPGTQTYKIKFAGLDFEYSKVAIARLDNQTFNPPALVFRLPGAGTRFSNISYKLLDSTGAELRNGGLVPDENENLTVIPFDAAIRRIRWELIPLTGSAIVYEVQI